MTIEEFTPGLMLIKGGTGHKFDDPVPGEILVFHPRRFTAGSMERGGISNHRGT